MDSRQDLEWACLKCLPRADPRRYFSLRLADLAFLNRRSLLVSLPRYIDGVRKHEQDYRGRN